jgi:hypothetical protein
MKDKKTDDKKPEIRFSAARIPFDDVMARVVQVKPEKADKQPRAKRKAKD